jgi:hypothetical protein
MEGAHGVAKEAPEGSSAADALAEQVGYIAVRVSDMHANAHVQSGCLFIYGIEVGIVDETFSFYAPHKYRNSAVLLGES